METASAWTTGTIAKGFGLSFGWMISARSPGQFALPSAERASPRRSFSGCMAKPLGQVSIFAGFARDKPPAAAPQSVRGAFSQVDKEAAQGQRRQKEMLIQSGQGARWRRRRKSR